MKIVSKIYICEYCGKEFAPAHRHNLNKFCSKQCYWDSKKKKVTNVCIECKKPFQAVPSHRGKFCSRECFYKNVGKNSIDAPCMTCGEMVHKWKSEIYPSGNIYCSRACATEAVKKPGWLEAYKSTPKFKLNERVRGGIRKSVKIGKDGRHWEDLVGYTLEQLKKHLEKQFEPGMTWDKLFAGEIHIDHKIPITAHNFEKPEDEDFRSCWSLNNLQPLWAKDNLSKNSKLDKPFQPSLVFG